MVLLLPDRIVNKFNDTIDNLIMDNFENLSNGLFDFDKFILEYNNLSHNNLDYISAHNFLLTSLRHQILCTKFHNSYIFYRNLFCVQSVFFTFCFLSHRFYKRFYFYPPINHFFVIFKYMALTVFSFTGVYALTFRVLFFIYSNLSL